VEPIFAAAPANDPSWITPLAAAQRMEEDFFVPELPHQLYQGDTPLHLAAAALLSDGANPRAATKKEGSTLCTSLSPPPAPPEPPAPATSSSRSSASSSPPVPPCPTPTATAPPPPTASRARPCATP
jgi:hypothetical protein